MIGHLQVWLDCSGRVVFGLVVLGCPQQTIRGPETGQAK